MTLAWAKLCPWPWKQRQRKQEQTQAVSSKKVSAQQRKQRQRHNLKSRKIFAKYTSEKLYSNNSVARTETIQWIVSPASQRSWWAHPALSQALGKLTHRQPKVAKRTWGCWWRWEGDKRRQGVGANRMHCVCVGSYQRTNLINNK